MILVFVFPFIGRSHISKAAMDDDDVNVAMGMVDALENCGGHWLSQKRHVQGLSMFVVHVLVFSAITTCLKSLEKLICHLDLEN